MTITVYVKPAEILGREKSLKKELKSRALARKIVKTIDELAVRDILPATDLGYTNETWETSALTQYAYNSVISLRIPERKIIGFYGIRDLGGGIGTGLTGVLRFSIGPGKAKTLEVVDIEKVHTEKEQEGFFDKPIFYENGQYAEVEFYATDTGTSKVKLLGFIAEPKGELVGQSG